VLEQLGDSLLEELVVHNEKSQKNSQLFNADLIRPNPNHPRLLHTLGGIRGW